MRAGPCVRELYCWWWMRRACRTPKLNRALSPSKPAHPKCVHPDVSGSQMAACVAECRWGVMVSAYPNKLISTISVRFLPMDPWSSPKVWRVQGRGGVMSPWFYKPQICDLEEFGEYFNLMAVRLGQVVFMCFAGIFTGFGLNAGVFPDRQSEHNWTTSNQS